MTTILSILNEVGATTSKLEKQAILERNSGNKLLKEVFVAAYDPTIKYYIRKIPEYKSINKCDLDWGVCALKALSSRTFTGTEAINYLADVLRNLSPDDATVVERIIKNDLRIGCSESTANKVWKNLIPEYPYMRCSLPEKAKIHQWLWSLGIFSQQKCDGQFMNFDTVDADTVLLTSRSGSEHDNTNFTDIIAAGLKMFPSNYRVNGELLGYYNGKLLPREESNGMVNSMLKGGKMEPGFTVKYVVWDIIPLANAVPGGKFGMSYEDRFAYLSSCIKNGGANSPIELVETKIVYSIEEAYQHYFEMVGKGLEGTVVKTRSGIWRDSTSTDQAKLKVVFEVDLEILGFTAGNGKNESTFGSVTVGTSDRMLLVNVSGFKDKKDPKAPHIPTRQEIWDMRDELIGTIMATKANGIMVPKAHGDVYSLFSPRFAELRLDKKTADTYVQVRAQFEAVVNPK